MIVFRCFLSGEQRCAAGLRWLGLLLPRARGEARQVENGTDRPAQLFRRIPDIQRPFLVAPCHDSIWSDQQRAGFLDLAHALPLAVEVLRYD